MKIGEFKDKKVENIVETLDTSMIPITESVEPEEAVRYVFGITPDNPQYEKTVADLRRLKQNNPRQYRKIVNFD